MRRQRHFCERERDLIIIIIVIVIIPITALHSTAQTMPASLLLRAHNQRQVLKSNVCLREAGKSDFATLSVFVGLSLCLFFELNQLSCTISQLPVQ